MTILPLLLESEDHYAIPKETLGESSATVIVWAQVMPIIMLPFLTYIYEVVGRCLTINYALISMVILVPLMPLAAPNFTLLCIIRAIIGMSTSILLGAPLISDYIKKESRGQAVAQNLLAAFLGQATTSQVLIPLTIDMSYNQSFALVSLMLFALSLPLICIIREPSDKKAKKSQ